MVFNIPIEVALQTMRVTNRDFPRNTTDTTLNVRHHQNDQLLRYGRLKYVLYCDTSFAVATRGKKKKPGKSGTSVRGNTCFEVFATDFGWVGFYPLQARKEVHLAIKKLFRKYGVPEKIVMDPAKEQVSGETLTYCNSMGCEIVATESGIPCKRAEAVVRRFKHRIINRLEESNSPAIFWDYCGEREEKIINSTAPASPVFKYRCQGQVPESVMTGKPTDISAISAFKWWEIVKYKLEGEKYPFSSRFLGRCLGPSDFGSELCYNVLSEKGKVIPVSTLRSLTKAELNSPVLKERVSVFDSFVKERFGDPYSSPKTPLKSYVDADYAVDVEDEKKVDFNDAYISVPIDTFGDHFYEKSSYKSNIPEVDEFENYENYLNAEVLLPQNGAHMRAAKVIGRAKDIDGMSLGDYDSNPYLDTRVYNVMFPDGVVEQYAANVLADNFVRVCICSMVLLYIYLDHSICES